MNTWTKTELDKIARAEELEIATRRRDGTLREPVTVWVVRHGDDLYVRLVNGRKSSWFRGAEARHEGHIQAGGVDKDVALVETDNVNDEVDAEYRTNGYLAGLLPITDLARALAVGPRSGRTKVPS